MDDVWAGGREDRPQAEDLGGESDRRMTSRLPRNDLRARREGALAQFGVGLGGDRHAPAAAALVGDEVADAFPTPPSPVWDTWRTRMAAWP